MATRLGMVPAVLCIVAAALLGGWGWAARADSSDRARDEAARREALGESDDGSLFGGMEAPDPVTFSCDLLIAAARLEPPSDPSAPFGVGGPGGAPATTMATSTIDTAWTLVGLLNEDLVAGIPELDQPELVAAIDGLRRAIQTSLTHTAEPLADPDVIGAAADLRGALAGPCL